MDVDKFESHSLFSSLEKIDGEGEVIETTTTTRRLHSSYGSLSKRSLQEVTPVTLSWHNITIVEPKSQKKILDRVSGVAHPGQLIALMGSSGAGKTTLLNTLLSRNMKGLTVDGSVLVDGRQLGTDISQVSGYVQQDELFMPSLTVREHLTIQGQLRLVGYSQTQIRRRVTDIINELGLTNCQHTRIGETGISKGISGGEARRLLFAAEMLDNPPLLFADEPTTGLDSNMAESVINVMARLAHSGHRTIITTIHQPSSAIYRQFDAVMFLADGRLAYFGAPASAVEMLARFGYPCPLNYNPADMIIEKLSVEPTNETACLERITSICSEFDESPEAVSLYDQVKECRLTVGKIPEKRRRASRFVQTKILLHRYLLDNWRNSTLTQAKIMQKIIMGLFIGLLYWQTQINTQIGLSNINGALYYIVAELTYSVMFGIIEFLPRDYPLVVREYHDGLYSVSSYYVARAISFMPQFILDGAILVSLSYWMTGFTPTLTNYLIALGIAVLVEQSAVAFGVMLSSASPSFAVAISIAGPIMTLISLNGGLFANVGELPIYAKIFGIISWFRYGFESLMINQWNGAASLGRCIGGNSSTTATDSTHCFSPDAVLANYSFSASNFYPNLISMFIFIFVFHFIGFLGLFTRVKLSR